MSSVEYTTVRACPVCGALRGVALHEQRFALPEDSPLPPVYIVASCDGCGACFADTPAPQAAYDRHYKQGAKYEDPALGTGGGSSAADRARLDGAAALIARQPLPRGPASRVLDVGCAGGGLLDALAKRGFGELSGLDPSSACVERVRARGFDCHQGMLSDLASALPPGATYDVVILSHVLEHVVEVGSALSQVRERLVADGVCYVEVPDAGRYAIESFVPFYFFDAEHINHFDGESLANLAAAVGFDVAAAGSRDLVLDGGKRYPVAWVLLRNGASARPIARDLALRARIRAYIDASTDARDPAALDALAASRRPVLLWGAGSHAQRMLRDSPLGRCNLVGVVDRDKGKQGRAFCGHSIRDPDAALPELPAEVTIVIASVLHGEEIAASIAAAGFRNPLLLAR